MSKTITLNLEAERAVLDKTLFRGSELIRGGADSFHALRLFTNLPPNARGVSKEILDRDQAALKAIFKASSGTKAAVGAGFGGTSTAKARSGASSYSSSASQYNNFSTAPFPGPFSIGMGVQEPAGG